MQKEFSQELFNSNDGTARQVMKKYLSQYPELSVFDNPDKYDIDLLVYKNDKLIGAIECEIKHSWKSDVFPFNTVQIPERKQKYINKYQVPVVFAVINKKLNRAIIVSDKILNNAKIVEVPNKYVRSGEKFFQVPVNRNMIINLLV